MSEDKNSNLMIIGLGIVAMFFAYLIYVKSKDTTIPVSTPIYTPIEQSTQSIDNIQLYNIQLQTQQINETLRLQMNQIQSIQEQQLKQSESITNLETIKLSNVVSMNNRNDNTVNDIKNKSETTKMSNVIPIDNISGKNEEFISSTIFGMK